MSNTNTLTGRARRLHNQIKNFTSEVHENTYPLQLLNYNQQQQIAHFVIHGGLGSPYQGYGLEIQALYPSDYPFRPPKCKFITKIWNPYVGYQDGSICVDILKEMWSPSLTIEKVLLSIVTLLSQKKVDGDEFLNPQAGSQIRNNYNYFFQQARKRIKNDTNRTKTIFNQSMRGVPQEIDIITQFQKMQLKTKEQIEQKIVKFKQIPSTQEVQSVALFQQSQLKLFQQNIQKEQENSNQN